MTFEGDGIKATITTMPFDPSKHKFIYDEKYVTELIKKHIMVATERCRSDI